MADHPAPRAAPKQPWLDAAAPRLTLLWRLFVNGYPLVIFACGVVHVVTNSSERLFGDEWRYLWYAKNLTHGYFSPVDNAMIWNGPGYPLMLVPFVAAGAPLVLPKLLNALLIALAVLYFHRTLLLYGSTMRATVGGLALGFYPLVWRYLPLVYTETFTVFLVSACFFHFCRASRDPRPMPHGLFAGLSLGALVLTKVSFGPVLLASLAAALGAWAFSVRSPLLNRIGWTTLIALALTSPWLIYTHHMSGKWFYWSSGGGQMLYWMATPFPPELGDWFHHRNVQELPLLELHHGEVYRTLRGDLAAVAGTDLERQLPGIGKLCSVEADLAFFRLGLDSMRAHPLSYLRNWILNVSRLFFDSPYTFRYDIDLRVAVPNLILLATVLAVCVQRARRRIALPRELEMIGIFALLATGVSTLLSATGRFFLPLYPAYLLLAMVGTQSAFARASFSCQKRMASR